MFIQRTIIPQIIEHLDKKAFTIINGARQTGKTTVLKYLLKYIEYRGNKAWFISFEREDILREINKNPENIFRFVERPKNPMHENQDEIFYLLIDEIQYAANPSNFLKYLYDTYSPNLKIIATGSSSFYLDQKFKDSLSGRKRIFTLRTLSFEEFLLFKNQQKLFDELVLIRELPDYISLQNIQLMEQFEDFITFGGYPEVAKTDNVEEKINILNEIKNSYIKRDVLESRIDNEQKFYMLMQVLSLQTGNLLNKHELSKSLRIDIKTVDKYLYVLQKCFHITLITPFYKNLKKELVKMPKVYFNDLGLRNLLCGNFNSPSIRLDKGSLLENYVLIRLLEKYNYDEIKFWRTADKNEVDFVVNPLLSPSFALEIKFSLSNLRRNSYNQFIKTYPEIPLKFVSFTIDDETDDTISSIKL